MSCMVIIQVTVRCVCVCVCVCIYYQLEEASPTAVNEFLTALINSVIDELQQSHFLGIEKVGIWLSTSYQKAIHYPHHVIAGAYAEI